MMALYFVTERRFFGGWRWTFRLGSEVGTVVATSRTYRTEQEANESVRMLLNVFVGKLGDIDVRLVRPGGMTSKTVSQWARS